MNVDSFAVMLRSVAEKLYDLDNSVIERMARNNEHFPGWAVPVFSYDVNAIRGDAELKKGTGIFISTGYSASDIVVFIRALLRAYDLDVEEDFVYSARSNKTENSAEN